MTLADGLDSIGTWLVALAIGRLCLSLLPAGRPGFHEPRELPATASASLLLGLVALALERRACARLGLELEGWRLCVPWIPVALLRWFTLPGAMVPRHDVRRRGLSPGLGAGARALAWGTPLALLLGLRFVAEREDFGFPWVIAVLALFVLVDDALASARRATLGARSMLLVLAGMFWLHRAHLGPRWIAAACLAGGAALAVAWLRRADARAGACAVICVAGAALFDARILPLAFGALCGLCACVPAPLRRTAWLGAVAAMLVVGLLVERPADWAPAALFEREVVWRWLQYALLGVSLLCACARMIGARARLRGARRTRVVAAARIAPLGIDQGGTGAIDASLEAREDPSGDPPGRELDALCAALLGAVLLTLVDAGFERGRIGTHALLPLGALACLVAALALLPAERTAARGASS